MAPVTRQLTSNAQPEYQGSASEFNSHVENNTYWGVLPAKYFTESNGAITMDSELASKLDWILYEHHGTTWTAAITTQSIELSGETYHINAGAFPAFIDETAVITAE